MSKFWTKNGKLVLFDGKLKVCDDCVCETFVDCIYCIDQQAAQEYKVVITGTPCAGTYYLDYLGFCVWRLDVSPGAYLTLEFQLNAVVVSWYQASNNVQAVKYPGSNPFDCLVQWEDDDFPFGFGPSGRSCSGGSFTVEPA